MVHQAWALLLYSLFYQAATLPTLALAAVECDFRPVYIPIRDVTLSNGNVIRGVNMSIGNPPQHFAAVPSMQSNNTWVYNKTGFCGEEWSEKACLTRRGGYYTLPEEVIERPILDPTAIGANLFDNDSFRVDYKKAIWARDRLQLTSGSTASIAIDDFPVGVLGHDLEFATQTSIGLGPASTLLDSLKKRGIIGSRVVSYWYGLDGAFPSTQMDGSLILGGYDAAKIKDAHVNYTGKIDPNVYRFCPSGMIVPVSDMLMKFPNGAAPNLLGLNLGVCICPECPNVMNLALDPYFIRYEELSDTKAIGRSLGTNFYSMLYPPSNVFPGNVEFKIGTGLAVTVQNSQLIVPELTIDRQSGRLTANNTVRNVLLLPLQDINKNDSPRFGRAFFTSSVLMVNYDTSSFTIWAANPSSETNIVSVTSDVGCKTKSGATTLGPGNPPSPTGTDPTTDSGIDEGKPSKAIIIGSVMGGVALISVIALVFFLRRRRRHRKAATATGNDTRLTHFHDATSDTAHDMTYPEVVPEKWKRTEPTQELYGSEAAVGVRSIGSPPELGANEYYELPVASFEREPLSPGGRQRF